MPADSGDIRFTEPVNNRIIWQRTEDFRPLEPAHAIKSIGEDKKMKRWICIAMMIMMTMTAAAGIAEETIRRETDGQDPMGGALITGLDQLDETIRSYYQAMINEKDRFDYQDYGEGAAGYQYALVYMDEGDAIPALLLAECSWDGVRFIKVFQYDPEKPGLWENLDPLNEYRNMLYLREGGKGLLLWYSDGAYDSGIMEVRLEQYSLKYNQLWYGANGTWPDDIPKEDIQWTDIP